MVMIIVENLRGFFVSRPPLVIFMICLGSFAVALITFAYIIKIKDMPNPDVTEDWNTFLDGLQETEFCVVSYTEEAVGLSLPTQRPDQPLINHLLNIHKTRAQDEDPSPVIPVSAPTTTVTPSTADQLVNITMRLDVKIYATYKLVNLTSFHNLTIINTSLRGHQIGLTGRRKNLEANVTLVLPSLKQSSRCSHSNCYALRSCVTFTAPPSFFPHTKRPRDDESCPRELDFGTDGHFHLEVVHGFHQCRNASPLILSHTYDPELTVMLSLQDRSLINLHLMHTSYFLFVMVITLFCYGLIKGHPAKVKAFHAHVAEKVPSQV
ncbi:transmembrane protein 248-like [Pomacea canaliculata]|uniref:transmembrane protein 248-like n=1 Tax=Pomacea canaliculata TaxID=400727 RepID=UPI000D736694|nr:transmembrane protein 248-like [Pomacea canaliculata]